MTTEKDSEVMNQNDGMEKITRMFAEQNLHHVPPSRLYELSPEERLAGLQDVHGASDLVEETLDFIQESLDAMDRELDLVTTVDRTAFDHARTHGPDFVKGLRLCFLRSEDFQIQRAARRMIGYFNSKLAAFGDKEILGREIRLSDLNDEKDRHALNVGLVQLLANRDRVGRPVVLINPAAAGNRTIYHRPSMLRLLAWTMALTTKLGDDVQRKGVVILWFAFDPPLSPTPRTGTNLFALLSFACIRVNAIHACTNDLRIKLVLDTIGRESDAKYVVRFQSHFGSPLECSYNLMRFGIARQILPLNPDGTVHCRDHHNFIARMQQSSEALIAQGQVIQQENPILIPQPRFMDVVLGRGQRGNKYKGNLLLKELLESNYDAYDKGSAQFRTFLASLIYKRIVVGGSRFLAPSGDSDWVEVDETAALDRIGHGFRNIRLKSKRQWQ